MVSHVIIRNSFKIFALILLAFFSYLMLKISLQYIPYSSDSAFLRIKHDVVHYFWYLPAFHVHAYSSIFLLLAGFTQFSSHLRIKYPIVHRYIGKLYVILLLGLAAPSGFLIGLVANGGLSSQIAFCLLAILWFYFTLRGFWAIQQSNVSSHRAFLLRSFALTLSAITLRAWKWLLVFLFTPRPMDVYIVVAWLGWVPNLLVVEIFLYYENRRNK